MARMIPSLNWLRVFEAAARVENFARAAESLNMSTSAVSQQIKALEHHLGTELFNRGPKNVELTEAGRAFLPSVRQSLNSIEETAVSLFGKESKHTLTLQCDLLLATSWLAHRLSDFERRYPEIQLHVTGAYHDLDYQKAGSELSILFGPVHRSWAQCDHLFEDDIYPVARADIAKSVQCGEDLLNHRLIQISTHRVNWNQLAQLHDIESIPTRQFCFVDSTVIALTLASSGMGIALARSPTTDRLVDKLGLVRCALDGEVRSPEGYYLIYQNAENLSDPARRFRQWLIEQAKTPSTPPAM